MTNGGEGIIHRGEYEGKVVAVRECLLPRVRDQNDDFEVVYNSCDGVLILIRL